MTPAKKAKELVGKMYGNMPLCADRSGRMMFGKQCALIAVGELINQYAMDSMDYEYWQQVKSEINKL